MRTYQVMPAARYQRGVALVMAMVFLMILTIIGVTVMSSTALQEKMAGNVQDKNAAFQAAESALRSGETYLQNNTPPPPFDGTIVGLYQPQPGSSQPRWETVNWTACAASGAPNPGNGVVCLPNNTIAKVRTQPKYIVEQIDNVNAGPPTGTSLVQPFTYGTTTPGGGQTMYRVTAFGTGGTDAATVMVQSMYRR